MFHGEFMPGGKGTSFNVVFANLLIIIYNVGAENGRSDILRKNPF